VLASQSSNDNDNNNSDDNKNRNNKEERPKVVEKVDCRKSSNSNNHHQDHPKEEWLSSWNNWLDRPFFDPDQILQENYEKMDKDRQEQEGAAAGGGPKKKNKDSSSKMAVWFATLVKKDYALAETIYVGVIGMILIILTQEVLRMQLYGDDYGGFFANNHHGSGRLF
jgi:hypothetical protein